MSKNRPKITKDKHSSLQYIRSRRSVFPKEYEDSRLSPTEIQELLEAARWAPTHKLTEPWRFVVVMNQGLIRFSQLLSEILRIKGDGTEVQQLITSSITKLNQTSSLIAIVMRRDSRARIPENEELWATACAVQNVQLHAQSLNIGCYWSTGAETNHPKVRSFLKLEDAEIQMGWLYCGRFTGQKSLINERLPVAEYVRWID